jgi:hypothetical protein
MLPMNFRDTRARTRSRRRASDPTSSGGNAGGGRGDLDGSVAGAAEDGGDGGPDLDLIADPLFSLPTGVFRQMPPPRFRQLSAADIAAVTTVLQQ